MPPLAYRPCLMSLRLRIQEQGRLRQEFTPHLSTHSSPLATGGREFATAHGNWRSLDLAERRSAGASLHICYSGRCHRSASCRVA